MKQLEFIINPLREKVKKTGRPVILLALLTTLLTGCNQNQNVEVGSQPPTTPTPPVTEPTISPSPTPTETKIKPSEYNEAAKLFRETLQQNLFQLYTNTTSQLYDDKPCIRAEIPPDAKVIIVFEVQTSQGLVRAKLFPKLGTERRTYDDFGNPTSISISLDPVCDCELDSVRIRLSSDENPQGVIDWEKLQTELLTKPVDFQNVKLVSINDLIARGEPPIGTNWSESYGIQLDKNAGWIVVNAGPMASHQVVSVTD